MKTKIAFLLLSFCLVATALPADTNKPPVRIAIIGLVHSHVHGFLPRVLKEHDVQLVGIVESNPKLVAANAERYHLNTNLFFPSLADLLSKTKPQAVATFTSRWVNASFVLPE